MSLDSWAELEWMFFKFVIYFWCPGSIFPYESHKLCHFYFCSFFESVRVVGVFFVSCYAVSLTVLEFVFLEEFVCHFCMLSTCKKWNVCGRFACAMPASLALQSLIEHGVCK